MIVKSSWEQEKRAHTFGLEPFEELSSELCFALYGPFRLYGISTADGLTEKPRELSMRSWLMHLHDLDGSSITRRHTFSDSLHRRRSEQF